VVGSEDWPTVRGDLALLGFRERGRAQQAALHGNSGSRSDWKPKRVLMRTPPVTSTNQTDRTHLKLGSRVGTPSMVPGTIHVKYSFAKDTLVFVYMSSSPDELANRCRLGCRSLARGGERARTRPLADVESAFSRPTDSTP
jgi:hypothetical protein